MRIRSIAVVAVALSVCGCDSVVPRAEVAAPKDSERVQRFVPVSGGTQGVIWSVPQAYLALDTQTGSLCRTWDFHWDRPDAVQSSLQELPTCQVVFANSAAH